MVKHNILSKHYEALMVDDITYNNTSSPYIFLRELKFGNEKIRDFRFQILNSETVMFIGIKYDSQTTSHMW